MGYLHSIIRNDRGTAAVEMALLLPLLITLMFGSMELGNYFYNEHKVVKNVRDAARYAARLPFDNFDCGSDSIADSALETQVKNLVRYGILEPGQTDTPVIRDWDNYDDIAVTVSCADEAVDGSGDGNVTTGIYDGMESAPIVTVSVTGLAYPSLFGALGFDASALTLNASSTAAVMGI